MKRFLRAFIFFAFLLGAWEAVCRAGWVSEIFAPSPTQVVEYFVTSFRDGTLLQGTLITSERLFLGYFFGLLLGIPMGLINSRFKTSQDTIGLLALGLQTLPSVCWAPLALLWFGQNEGAMFFIVIMGSLWSILLAADAGVRNVPPIYVRAAQTMGSQGLHTWIKVVMPASLPFIISGMKQGWAFAWRSLMAAEIYITVLDRVGLGNLLHYGRELHAMDAVVGIIILIMVIGLLVDKLVFAPVERSMHKRWGTGRA